MHHRTIAIAGIVLAFALVGCSADAVPPSSSASAGSDEAELVSAAQAEGSLTWYTGTSPTAAEAVAAAFQDEYGVSVNVVRLTSNEIAQRFQAEAAAEDVQADVLLTVAEQFFVDMREQDLTIELDPADYDDYPSEYVLPGGAGFTIGINMPVIVYNTEVLGDFKPETWDDLLDPRLKGELVISDPRGSNAWAQFWTVVLEDPDLGEKYLTAIADQDFQLTASTVPGTQLVGAGEGGVLIAGIVGSTQPSIDQGLPLAMFTPGDPTVTGRNWAAIATEAPHPNAARLFLKWLVTADGSAVYNSLEASGSPLGDIGADVPVVPDDAAPPPSAEQVANDLPRILSLLGIE